MRGKKKEKITFCLKKRQFYLHIKRICVTLQPDLRKAHSEHNDT